MICLIPMAGRGSRFSAEGYNLPKPFIPVMNRPMFMAAIMSLPQADRYILIGQKDFEERYSFQEYAQTHIPNCKVLTVDGVTEGQTSTCLIAEPELNTEETLFIACCDSQLVYDDAYYQTLLNDTSIDVIIWTFQMGSITKKDPIAFAYCRVEDGRVVEVVEKRTISDTPHKDPAVVGAFTYRRAADFLDSSHAMIAKNIRVNNEFYVGTSINQLIEAGKKVVHFPVDKFISFGDPFELQIYQAWEDYFFNEKQHPYKGS